MKKEWIPIQCENIPPTEYERRQGHLGSTKISESVLLKDDDKICQKITFKFDNDGNLECAETRMYLKRRR